ncbi:hypothetical protein G7Z17_g4409 [Cylindrodendrum hubeiense]|uniref:Uncharacterized protein n=1 Tax=Cylindrodendrum hubeiense TaxID=595255 RepID=A0A9P5LCN4_9HYPO|nr:hypothetical protein G7Z17_g4409 [Cylindrodendrum hubeiense]
MSMFVRLPHAVRRVVPTVPLRTSIAPNVTATTRQFHSTRPAQKSHNPRWLSDVKARLKRCQELDIAPQQVQKAKELSNYVQSNWLELLAGEEGFLTGKEWRGLDNHQVTWGDMDSMPMDFPDRTTVLHKLISPPNYDSDHVLLEAVILSERHQRPAARCFEDIVVFNYKTAKKTPLKGFMVDELRKTFEKQEASKKECEDKIESIIKAVEQIETSAA